MRRSRWTLVRLLLALASPALAGPVRCTTYEEKTLGRLQTLCDDGSRAVSTWSPTLGRWDTTVTPPPGQTCTGRFNIVRMEERRDNVVTKVWTIQPPVCLIRWDFIITAQLVDNVTSARITGFQASPE